MHWDINVDLGGLPRVSYVKAIDVWMFTNLVFVFVAFMEYAVVTVMARRSKSDVYSYTIQVGI